MKKRYILSTLILFLVSCKSPEETKINNLKFKNFSNLNFKLIDEKEGLKTLIKVKENLIKYKGIFGCSIYDENLYDIVEIQDVKSKKSFKILKDNNDTEYNYIEPKNNKVYSYSLKTNIDNKVSKEVNSYNGELTIFNPLSNYDFDSLEEITRFSETSHKFYKSKDIYCVEFIDGFDETNYQRIYYDSKYIYEDNSLYSMIIPGGNEKYKFVKTCKFTYNISFNNKEASEFRKQFKNVEITNN